VSAWLAGERGARSSASDATAGGYLVSSASAKIACESPAQRRCGSSCHLGATLTERPRAPVGRHLPFELARVGASKSAGIGLAIGEASCEHRPMPTGRVPGPIGVTKTSGVARTTAASIGSASVERSREQFKKAVLQGQIRRKQSQGKTYVDAVPEDELDEVESGFKMRKEAARSCRDLLRAARAALAEAQKANDATALRTSAIGVCSAYRDYNDDATAWSNTFDKHYDKEPNRTRMEAMRGGRHGDAAVQWFVELMAPLKAPPGFSNHSNGHAVDFSTRESGVTYGADSDKRAEWRRTWLHPWLTSNASSYRFSPLSSEEWHWDWS
jgi:hypothetical protein